MAYDGCIDYFDVPGHTVTWMDLKLQLTGSAQCSWLKATEPLKFEADALDFEIMASPNDKSWLIVYDNPTEAHNNDKCVIIGNAGNFLRYILVVRLAGPMGASGALYERVGAGYIPFAWIKPRSVPIQIV